MQETAGSPGTVENAHGTQPSCLWKVLENTGQLPVLSRIGLPLKWHWHAWGHRRFELAWLHSSEMAASELMNSEMESACYACSFRLSLLSGQILGRNVPVAGPDSLNIR